MDFLIRNPNPFGFLGEIGLFNRKWRMDARVSMTRLRYGGITTPIAIDKMVSPCTSDILE